jgi:hypothetical protein
LPARRSRRKERVTMVRSDAAALWPGRSGCFQHLGRPLHGVIAASKATVRFYRLPRVKTF